MCLKKQTLHFQKTLLTLLVYNQKVMGRRGVLEDGSQTVWRPGGRGVLEDRGQRAGHPGGWESEGVASWRVGRPGGWGSEGGAAAEEDQPLRQTGVFSVRLKHRQVSG